MLWREEFGNDKTCPAELSSINKVIFCSPGRSPGRAIVLPPASVLASVAESALAKCLNFYVKVFYVMGKALSGELSYLCDRSCCRTCLRMHAGQVHASVQICLGHNFYIYAWISK